MFPEPAIQRVLADAVVNGGAVEHEDGGLAIASPWELRGGRL
ncbi:hypothetical protein [Ralstonia sp. 1138]